MSLVQHRTFGIGQQLYRPTATRLRQRCDERSIGRSDPLFLMDGRVRLEARIRPRTYATGEGSGVSDGEKFELTKAEEAMIQLDYLEDPDAQQADPITAELEDVFSESVVFDDGSEQLMIGTESMDQGYIDRKEFIDYDALEKAREFGKAMAIVADELKCQSIRLLDVHKKVYWTDLFLVLTAMSRTQMNAVLGKMEKVALEEWGIPVQEAVSRRSEWECIDFGSLIVHAFSPRTRRYYQLEEVYGQCEEVHSHISFLCKSAVF